ncbi:hypothetical protein C450_13652 [Halococcus salifodinae DSM 8989]|uniref:Uncharacterized protein n=1 Tax=Halococcus salifodinae DSM 8989 TaxID=1227456 RepID=M0N1Z1_9EURY|nr:hypothetical protein C450_13652 [Halococcus salifodinae DSM 8989]
MPRTELTSEYRVAESVVSGRPRSGVVRSAVWFGAVLVDEGRVSETNEGFGGAVWSGCGAESVSNCTANEATGRVSGCF